MKKLIIIFISTLLLISCGFHLRGFEELQVQSQPIYVSSKTSNGSFTRKLINHLRSSNVQIADTPEKARTKILILKEKIITRKTSVGSSQQTQEYIVTYEVIYRVQSQEPITIKANRQIITLPNEELTSSNKFEETIQDMEEELITQINLK